MHRSRGLGPRQDALELIGKWNGTIESGSFNLKSPISFELTNDGFEVDSGPFCPSNMDPDPALITLDDGMLNGNTWMMSSGILGDVTVTFDFDQGTFVGSGNPFVYQVDFNGTLQPESIALAWEVSIQGLVVDAGTGAFVKEGSDAELCGLPVPSSAPVVPDCPSVVPETSGVGGDCGAECVAPNGACIDGVCRQVCVPFQCESRCSDTDLCVAVSGQTFNDGSQLGACVPEPQGTQGSPTRCAAVSRVIASRATTVSAFSETPSTSAIPSARSATPVRPSTARPPLAVTSSTARPGSCTARSRATTPATPPVPPGSSACPR